MSISIHALREEGDLGEPVILFLESEFLSTPSARRATNRAEPYARHKNNFYPRPPRGGRLGELLHSAGRHVISIHALREEGDRCPPSGCRS